MDDYRSFYDKIRDWQDFELGLREAINVQDDFELGNLVTEGKGSGKGKQMMSVDGQWKDQGDKKDSKKDEKWNDW